MAETFSGDLTLFKLIDILRLLSQGKKSGQLRLERGGVGGEIYFETGDIVHATCRAEKGEEALFSVLTWMEGSFRFLPERRADEHSIETETSVLLDAGMRRIDEWDQIKEIVPSPDIIFRLSSSRAPREVTIKQNEWRVLSEIDGKKSVGDISEDLGLRDYDAARMFYALFEVGLIEVAAELKLRSKKTVDPGFLDFLEQRLTQIIGPVASVVLDEEIRAMGEERKQFPLDKASLLVDKISHDIDDDGQRLEFQKNALAALRRI